MSNSSPASSTGNEIIKSKRNSRYRLYVWVITTSTILILALLAWPFTVKHFSSTAEIRLHCDPSSIESESANTIIAQSIADNTTDDRMLQLIEDIRVSHPIKSELFEEDKSVALRDAIKVATRPGRSINCVELKISIIGAGSQDEIAFVNRLSNAVATDLASGPSKKLNGDYLADWKKQFATQLADQNDFLFQASGLLNEQIALAIDQRNEISRTLPGMAFTEEPAEADEISSINLQHRISQIYLEMQRLQAANNWPLNHPELAGYQNQIDQLKNRLNQIYKTGGAQRVTNQFTNVASSTQRTTSTQQLLSQLRFEELETSGVIVAKLQKQLQNNQQLQKQMLDTMLVGIQNTKTQHDVIRLERFTLASTSNPVGGTPNTKTFLTLGFIAVLLGGAMAWQYKPEMRIRRFNSPEHASAVLGIPSLGTLRESRPATDADSARTWFVTSLFKTCEYVLLCLAILSIVAMLVNSDIFGTVMENPFQAISKVIWMITPR